jgi:hypothetical protein
LDDTHSCADKLYVGRRGVPQQCVTAAKDVFDVVSVSVAIVLIALSVEGLVSIPDVVFDVWRGGV